MTEVQAEPAAEALRTSRVATKSRHASYLDVLIALAVFLVLAVLPQLSSSLGVSHSGAGYLVTGYAAVVVLASLPLALATRRFSRRRLLIASLSVFVVCAAAAVPTQNIR